MFLLKPRSENENFNLIFMETVKALQGIWIIKQTQTKVRIKNQISILYFKKNFVFIYK